MNTVTRTNPMKSQNQHSNPWNSSIVVLPCIRPAAASSFNVGSWPYRVPHLPDSC